MVDTSSMFAVVTQPNRSWSADCPTERPTVGKVVDALYGRVGLEEGRYSS